MIYFSSCRISNRKRKAKSYDYENPKWQDGRI